MIKICDSHKHYNFLWDLEREQFNLQEIFDKIQDIIIQYDYELKYPFGEGEDEGLENNIINNIELLRERLEVAYNMGIGAEIYNDSRKAHDKDILINDGNWIKVYFDEDCSEHISHTLFSNNWLEEFKIIKENKENKKKEEETRKEKELFDIINSDEYKIYLEVKKKLDNI